MQQIDTADFSDDEDEGDTNSSASVMDITKMSSFMPPPAISLGGGAGGGINPLYQSDEEDV